MRFLLQVLGICILTNCTTSTRKYTCSPETQPPQCDLMLMYSDFHFNVNLTINFPLMITIFSNLWPIKYDSLLSKRYTHNHMKDILLLFEKRKYFWVEKYFWKMLINSKPFVLSTINTSHSWSSLCHHDQCNMLIAFMYHYCWEKDTYDLNSPYPVSSCYQPAEYNVVMEICLANNIILI